MDRILSFSNSMGTTLTIYKNLVRISPLAYKIIVPGLTRTFACKQRFFPWPGKEYCSMASYFVIIKTTTLSDHAILFIYNNLPTINTDLD